MDEIYLFDFLYRGIEVRDSNWKQISVKPHPKTRYAIRLGWRQFLLDLRFIGKNNFDYRSNPGFYLWSEDSKYLNGVFYISSSISGIFRIYNVIIRPIHFPVAS